MNALVLKKIHFIIQQNMRLEKTFGILFSMEKTVSDLLFPFLLRAKKSFIKRIYFKRRHYIIEKQLEKRVDLKKQINDCISNSSSSDVIWFCWLQGKRNMPKVPKECYQQLLNTTKRKIVFIDLKNYKDYVVLPQYIENKLERKLITFTHFTDILRFALLNKYGGLWLDSRFYLKSEFKKPFFKGDFYTIKLEVSDNQYVSNYKWVVGCMGGKPNVFFQLVLYNLYKYWENNDYQIDYFLIDYIIDIIYKKNKNIKAMIDKVPVNNLDSFYIENLLKERFNEDVWRQLRGELFLLPTKGENGIIKLYTEKREVTYWGYLLNEKAIINNHLDLLI